MKTILTIKGTHCNACKILIEDIAKEIPGVLMCDVDYASGKTHIEHNESIDWQKLKKEIESLGNYTIETL